MKPKFMDSKTSPSHKKFAADNLKGVFRTILLSHGKVTLCVTFQNDRIVQETKTVSMLSQFVKFVVCCLLFAPSAGVRAWRIKVGVQRSKFQNHHSDLSSIESKRTH